MQQCDWLEIAVCKANNLTLGLARIPKQLALQRIEAVRGREKPVTFRIPHHDSRGLRTDFDDVSVRHFLKRLLSRANNGARAQKFRVRKYEARGLPNSRH